MNDYLAEKILEATLSTGGDFSEIFIENKRSNSLTSTGGDIDEIVTGEEYGIGIRVFKGINSVYVYTNDFSDNNLLITAKEAAYAIGVDMSSYPIVKPGRILSKDDHKIITDPSSIPMKNRADIIKEIYQVAKSYHDSISQVQSGMIDHIQEVEIINSQGLHVKDKRTRCRYSITAVASDGALMNSGYTAPGAHMGFEFFEQSDYKAQAKEAARIAVTMLKAKNCPPGTMPVIIENGFGGVIFHEACGHGLEATSVAKNTSVFSGKLGTKVASDIVTAIDDGTIKNHWGSANFDDEGTMTQKNVLIENGILKSYLVDILNSRKMGIPANGCGRRQSYMYAPTSRMSNTYIAAGASSVDEMITSVDIGLYAKKMGGGSVNPATGEFNFAVLEGYMIKNGKITEPVKGASLIGRGHEILNMISMVGNNLDYGQGMCGSLSGMLPNNVGQPAIKVDQIVVGGGKQ